MRNAFVLLFLVAACGGSSQPDLTGFKLSTVFFIVMENHDWSDVKGNALAPFINGTLLTEGAHCEQYYSPPGLHPSEPNYITLEAGTNLGITNDDLPSANHQSSSAHLTRLLKDANVPWKSYQEDITGTVCPLGYHALYVPRHNPNVYFDDVTGNQDPTDAYCIAHNRPLTELDADLASPSLPRWVYITPNLCDDMHNPCGDDPLTLGDNWLEEWIPKIQASPAYQAGGVIFVTWDESEAMGMDVPIGMIALSRAARAGLASTMHHTHAATLRTVEEILGVTPLLGAAANEPDLAELFWQFP